MFFGGCGLLFGWLFVRGVSFLSCFPWAAFSTPLSNICSFCLSKKIYISKGGHATLIKSTLSNLPIYFLSVLYLSKTVKLRLEQIQRNFLWGGGQMEKKPHLVRWEIVCKDKRSGGLGMKNLGWLNKVLLSKWCWRFATKRGTLWNEVIRGKYGE